MTTVVLRADASVGVGTGHVMRSLALAQAISTAGGEPLLAVAECPEELLGRARSVGVGTHVLGVDVGSDRDVAATLALARARGASWVVLDGYGFGPDVQRGLRRAGQRVAQVDDFAHQEDYEVDLLLNPNSHAREDAYPRAGRRLLGPRYALLRPEFSAAIADGPARQVPPRARRILVTMGGSDPSNATGSVLAALERMGGADLAIQVLLGPANPHGEAVRAAAGALGGCEVLDAVEDMIPLLRWADLALGAGGSTLWELAALGVPCACVVLAENQAPIVEDLAGRGVVESLGWDRDLEVEACSRRLSALIGDPTRRASMAASGRDLVDGRGAERVAGALLGSGPGTSGS